MKKLLIVSLVILSLVLVGCGDNSITGGAVAGGLNAICADSDGGIDKETKGIVSVGEERYADSCVAGLLIEYSCEGNKVTNQNIRCDNKCSNGKCA